MNKGIKKGRSPNLDPARCTRYSLALVEGEGVAVLSLASSRSLTQPRVDSGEGLELVPLNDCFSIGIYRRLGTHLPEEVTRNTGCPAYSLSYPFLASRYLIVASLDAKACHKRLEHVGSSAGEDDHR